MCVFIFRKASQSLSIGHRGSVMAITALSLSFLEFLCNDFLRFFCLFFGREFQTPTLSFLSIFSVIERKVYIA